MDDLEAPLVSDRAFDCPDLPIAEGGMALIFEARDRRLPRKVILKKPRTQRRGGGALEEEERIAFVERLAAEAQVLARLNHPAIVTIHEIGRAGDGLPFCVLERVDGRPLHDLLDEISAAEARDRKPHIVERIQLVSNLIGIAEGLALAHERGIVHRDVTPNNILVGPQGEMTLIDWGIASDSRSPRKVSAAIDRALIDAAAAGMPADQRFMTIGAGTPPYVSYEQTQGMPAIPAYDIYSFGATLYHVVAGRPPFRYETITEFMEKIEGKEAPPAALAHDRDLSAIIAGAMAPDPADRPTAPELIAQLRAYLTGELVFAQRYSVTGRIARWVRKQRLAAAAIALVILAAVGAVVVYTKIQERAERTAREAAEGQAAAESRAADAEREAAAKAKAQAEAERQRADAVQARQKAEKVAETKEEEARRALAEANAAKGDSKRYKELKDKADLAAGAAEDARQNADEGLRRAEDAAKSAAEQADTAAKAAQQSRAQADTAEQQRDAAEQQRAAAEQARVAAEQARDEAVAQRNTAETQRSAAERARDEAVTQRDGAEQDLGAARARIAELERQLEEERKKPAAEPGPEPAPQPPPGP